MSQTSTWLFYSELWKSYRRRKTSLASATVPVHTRKRRGNLQKAQGSPVVCRTATVNFLLLEARLRDYVLLPANQNCYTEMKLKIREHEILNIVI